MKSKIIGVFSMFITISLCSSAQTERINFKAFDVYPEGTVYDMKANRFFVSSVRTGTIGTVDASNNYKPFYEEAALKSSFGMKVDRQRNKLWVCTGDPNYSKYADSATYKKMIRLIGIDLSSGKKTDDIDLSSLYPGKHFANDLALDDKGNIYITDSYSPVIYKVDAQMKASVFATSEWFKTEGIGLNGIVWNAKGFLIVANNGSGILYKVDLQQPERVTRIKIKNFFPGADGLLWNGDRLALAQNKGVNKIFLLASKDNWQSAESESATDGNDRFEQPSTITMKDQKILVLNSKLNELTDPTAPPAKEFSLQLARFISMK